MFLNKTKLRKASSRVALLLATGSLLATGISPAHAADATPLFLSFESNDLLKSDSVTSAFGDPGVEIAATTNLDGYSLKFTKTGTGQPWSGTNLIQTSSTPLRFADATKSTITLDYFSNDSLTSPVQLRLLGPGGVTATKVVDAVPGKSTLIFDMSTGQGWDATKEYNGLVIYPNFSANDNGYAGTGPVANTGQVYEIDNISIAGGTIANIYVPVVAPARVATSTLMTFETGDALGAAAAAPGFEGAVATIQDAPAAGNGGKALRIEKAGQPWSGIVLATAPSGVKFLDAAKKTVTMNYFSPQTVATPVQFQLEATDGSKINQAVEAAPGWSKLTIDFTAMYNDAKVYTIARLYPNFVNTATEVPGYTGAPGVDILPVKFYFVDNVGFNGATTPAIPAPPAPREATSTLVTFESGDALGSVVAGGSGGAKPQGAFGGSVTSIAVAPAGGNGGNALKIVRPTGSEAYAGANFIKFGTDKRVTNATHKTVTFNYHSSKANSPVRVELKGYPDPAVAQTVNAPLGWSTLSFDFTTANLWTSTEEFTLVAIFPDFDVAGAGDIFYVDNLAFNGAVTPAIPSVPVVREATSTLVTFETGDVLGAKVNGVTTPAKPEGGFEGALTTIENAPAGGNGGKALKIVKNGAAYAGVNIIKFGSDKRVTNGTHKTITLNYYSPKANSPTRIEVKGYPDTAVFKTVNAPLGWSKLTFDFTASPGWTATEEFVSVALFPDFDMAAAGGIFFVDNVAFNGATTPAIPVPAVKPSVSSAATATGTAKVAKTLTAGKGSWTGTATIAYTYKWYRCTVAATKTATAAPTASAKCVAISGGTKSTYKLTSADTGKYVRVLVTATNSAGTAYSLSKTSAKVVK